VEPSKVFVPERETNAKSLDEVRELLQSEYSFTSRQATITDLSITDDYKLKLNGDELAMTHWSFQGLLQLLKVPVRFGEEIPNDLLQTIVYRLRTVAPFGVQLFIEPEGNVINIKGANYRAPDLQTVAEALTGDVQLARVSVRGLQIATELPIAVEPKVGDTIKVGTYLVASQTGGVYPKANLMSFRLVCSNGAVVGDEFGSIHWSMKRTGGQDEFSEGLRELSKRGELVAQGLNEMGTKMLPDTEFSRLWRQVRYHFDAEVTDKMFFIDDPDVRKMYIARALVASKNRLEPSPTDLNSLDIFNSITQVARSQPYAKHEALMRIGGSMIPLN